MPEVHPLVVSQQTVNDLKQDLGPIHCNPGVSSIRHHYVRTALNRSRSRFVHSVRALIDPPPDFESSLGRIDARGSEYDERHVGRWGPAQPLGDFFGEGIGGVACCRSFIAPDNSSAISDGA